jgi:hypothetical protein
MLKGWLMMVLQQNEVCVACLQLGKKNDKFVSLPLPLIMKNIKKYTFLDPIN